MLKLIIEHDETKDTIALSGDIDALFKSRRAARFIKDNFSYLREDGSLTVSIEGDLASTLNKIKKLETLLDVDFAYTEQTSSELDEYETEEKKFLIFSEKARSIRDNECDAKEFDDFICSLESNMKARTLYQLQLLSAYHLAFSQNACNFSVPGAGKTSVVYGAFSYLSNLGSDNPKYIEKILVIGPLSSFGPWELEYEECFGKKPTVKRLSGEIGAEEKRQYLLSEDTATLTMLSYASVPSLVDELVYFLRNNKVMIVLDEAHKIKNTDGGVTAESVLSLASHGSARVVLTGTPVPNGYEDLYNLYKFIWPTKKVIPYEVYQLRDMSKSVSDGRVEELLHAIEPFFIRVKKSDLGLPPAIEHKPIVVPMSPVQRRIYDAIEKRFVDEMTAGKKSRFRDELVKARLVRLMQASTNPRLLETPLREYAETAGFDESLISEDSDLVGDLTRYLAQEIPQKFIAAKNLIQEIIDKGEKVVVWAVYIRNILELESYLNANGIACKTLYGSTPVGSEDECDVETRESIIKAFNQDDSSFRVVIANPFAVAESISLHKACHNAIYLERTFNAAHFMQSKDRIHRYGLPEGIETNYYYLLSEDSVDDVIHERLIIKEERMRAIIESMPIPLFENVGLETGDEDIKALILRYASRAKKM